MTHKEMTEEEHQEAIQVILDLADDVLELSEEIDALIEKVQAYEKENFPLGEMGEESK